MKEYDSLTKYGRLAGSPNQDFTPEVAARLGVAVGTFLAQEAGSSPIVVTARDFRRDARMLKRAFSGGLCSTGCDSLDLHACATSVLQVMVRRFGADAGVVFSNLHPVRNQIQLKIFNSFGIEISSQDLERILGIFRDDSKFQRVSLDHVGWVSAIESEGIYQRAIENFVNVKKIARSHFRVVLDCSLGPVSLIVPTILSEAAGVDIVSLNSYRPRIPAVLPTPTSIERASETVRAVRADLGIILESEGTRAAFLDHHGRVITPDDLALVLLNHELKDRQDGRITIGETISEYTAEAVGKKFQVFLAQNAPGNLARTSMESASFLAIDDQGTFILPAFSPSGDAILASLRVLDAMVETSKPLTELIESNKTTNDLVGASGFSNIKIGDEAPNIAKRLLEKKPNFATDVVDTLIGVKLILTDGWVHIYSPGQPEVLTLLSEGPDQVFVENTLSKAREVVQGILNSRK